MDNTSVVANINHQGGVHSHPRFRLVLQILLCSPWIPPFGNRHPVEAVAEAQGLLTPTSNSGVPLAEFQQSGSGLVCLRRVNPLSLLVLSQPFSSSGAGCHGRDVAEAKSVRLSPITLLPGVLPWVHQEGLQLILVVYFWPFL